MSSQSSNAEPIILISTRHEEIARKLSEQLSAMNCAARTLPVEQLSEPLIIQKAAPDIAFIDLCEETTKGLLPHRLLRATCSGCQIIFICTSTQTKTAAEFVRSGDVFDYVCIDAGEDRSRIPLLIDLARAVGRLPDTAEENYSHLQTEKALQSLGELREVIKRSGNANFFKAVEDYMAHVKDPTLEYDPSAWKDAKELDSLVDLICGRIRRIENYILLASGEETGSPMTPRSRVKKTQAGRKSRQDEERHQQGRRIMVVDDDEVSADLAQSVLEHAGFVVDVAHTSEAAYGILDQFSPDLILMDVHLNHVNGIQLVSALRKRESFFEVPVLIVTSDRRRELLMSAVEVDIQGYVLKPYDPIYLINKVQDVLQEYRPEHSDRLGNPKPVS